MKTGAPAWSKAEVTGVHSFPLAFTPDSKELATTGRPDLKSTADVTFCDMSHGKAGQAVSVRAAGEWAVQALAFAADGQRWASTQLVDSPSAKRRGEWSSVVSMWDRRADKPLRTWSAGSGQVHSLAFAARGELLVGRCRFPDHEEVWDSRSGALRHRFALGAKASGAVAVSSDGEVVTAAAGSGLRQRDLDTGRLRGSSAEGRGRALALSADGSLVLMLGADKSLQVWKVELLVRR